VRILMSVFRDLFLRVALAWLPEGMQFVHSSDQGQRFLLF